LATPGVGRARWRIAEADIQAWLHARTYQPPPPRRRSRRKRPAIKEYF
jgi:hypothetical protein